MACAPRRQEPASGRHRGEADVAEHVHHRHEETGEYLGAGARPAKLLVDRREALPALEFRAEGFHRLDTRRRLLDLAAEGSENVPLLEKTLGALRSIGGDCGISPPPLLAEYS
jgi:hypothetical protein